MAGRGWFGLPFFARKPEPAVVSCTLSGGGSRASFQLGALSYLYRWDEDFAPTILVGASAGAIIASALAQSAGRDEQQAYLGRLVGIWTGMSGQEDMFTPRPWYARLQEQGPAWLDMVRPVAKPEPKPRPLLPFLRQAPAASPDSPSDPMDPLEAALTPDEEVRSDWSLAALSGLAGNVGRLPRIGSDLNTIWHGFDQTRSMYRPGPVLAQLLHEDTFSSARVAASGVTLRIAMVALESGELRYMTESGSLVDRGNSPFDDDSHDLALGVLASCAIPAVFRPVPIGAETYVDGGARENLPAELAIGHLGAARNYVISSQRMGVQRRPSMADADLFSVVMRSTEILIDEAGRDELAYAHSTGAVVIYPELLIHDSMTVHPALIDINMAYGWLRAAECHLGLDETAEAKHRALIETRLSCLRAEEHYLSQEEPTRRDLLRLRSAKVELRDAVRSLGKDYLPPDAPQWWQRWERHPQGCGAEPAWLDAAT